MSNIILPGDPPIDEMRAYISNLHQRVIQQDQQLAYLMTTLIEVVMQHGINNAITLGPPILRGGSVQLRFEPTVSGGKTISIVAQEPEADEQNPHN